MIYLDNAATSFPKPKNVINAINYFLKNIGGSPGRSGHTKSLEASRIIFECREKLKDFFNAEDSENIIFTLNATESLNIVIQGFLKLEHSVLISELEHNSVMRPLNELKKTKNIKIIKIKHNKNGEMDKQDFIEKIKLKPDLVIINHVSNVNGIIQDLEFIAEIKKKSNFKILIDASQSAGVIKLNVKDLDIDFLAFTGHKSLFGPQGIGGLYIKEYENINPLKFGGTGSFSENEIQPNFLPDKFESGTPNTPAISGLLEGIKFITYQSLEKIHKHKKNLLEIFVKELEKIDKIKLYYGGSIENNGGVISLNIEGYPPSLLSTILDKEYKVATRPGLHCAPSAHKFLKTFPQGTVRFSFSIFNNEKEILEVTKILKEIIKNGTN